MNEYTLNELEVFSLDPLLEISHTHDRMQASSESLDHRCLIELFIVTINEINKCLPDTNKIHYYEGACGLKNKYAMADLLIFMSDPNALARKKFGKDLGLHGLYLAFGNRKYGFIEAMSLRVPYPELELRKKMILNPLFLVNRFVYLPRRDSYGNYHEEKYDSIDIVNRLQVNCWICNGNIVETGWGLKQSYELGHLKFIDRQTVLNNIRKEEKEKEEAKKLSIKRRSETVSIKRNLIARVCNHPACCNDSYFQQGFVVTLSRGLYSKTIRAGKPYRDRIHLYELGRVRSLPLICATCHVAAVRQKQRECHRCSDWGGCGTNCTDAGYACPQCGAKVAESEMTNPQIRCASSERVECKHEYKETCK